MRPPSKTEQMVIAYLEKMFARDNPWQSPVWKYLRQTGRLKLNKSGGLKGSQARPFEKTNQ